MVKNHAHVDSQGTSQNYHLALHSFSSNISSSRRLSSVRLHSLSILSTSPSSSCSSSPSPSLPNAFLSPCTTGLSQPLSPINLPHRLLLVSRLTPPTPSSSPSPTQGSTAIGYRQVALVAGRTW